MKTLSGFSCTTTIVVEKQQMATNVRSNFYNRGVAMNQFMSPDDR